MGSLFRILAAIGGCRADVLYAICRMWENVFLGRKVECEGSVVLFSSLGEGVLKTI
jgi:hypothetical protein